MREADMGASLSNFINNAPKWGVRLRFPNHQEATILNGPEIDAEIMIELGIFPNPPLNEKGEHAISAKKVRVSG